MQLLRFSVWHDDSHDTIARRSRFAGILYGKSPHPPHNNYSFSTTLLAIIIVISGVTSVDGY